MKEIIYYKTYDNKCPYLEYLKKGMNKMDIETLIELKTYIKKVKPHNLHLIEPTKKLLNI